MSDKNWNTKKELKQKAQDLLMDKISTVGYSIEELNLTSEEKEELRNETKNQMDRIAKMFGFDEAWFS